jgi:hypothetical protein
MLGLLVLLHLGEPPEVDGALPDGGRDPAGANQEVHTGAAEAVATSPDFDEGRLQLNAAGHPGNGAENDADGAKPEGNTGREEEEPGFAGYARQVCQRFNNKMKGILALLGWIGISATDAEQHRGAETAEKGGTATGGNKPGKATGGSTKAWKRSGTRGAKNVPKEAVLVAERVLQKASKAAPRRQEELKVEQMELHRESEALRRRQHEEPKAEQEGLQRGSDGVQEMWRRCLGQ